jgi:hypothetical protein
MKTKLSSKTTTAMQMLTICGLLAFGASAVAQSSRPSSSASESNGRCSNRTLNGDYGFSLEGTFLPSTPVRGVVMQHYDGNGGITQVDHLVVFGMPPQQEWTPGTGSYTVNPDCTGVAVLHAGPSTVNLHFVVVNNGKQIFQVVDADAVTAVGIRLN